MTVTCKYGGPPQPLFELHTYCPSCNERKSSLESFCGKCGHKLEERKVVREFCVCGREIDSFNRGKHCVYCGQPFAELANFLSKVRGRREAQRLREAFWIKFGIKKEFCACGRELSYPNNTGLCDSCMEILNERWNYDL